MIKIYDTLYLAECETDNTKTDVLLGEINKVKEVWAEVRKAVKQCEKKYKTKSYYYRGILLGNTEHRWNDDNTELLVVRTYDKYYYTIEWGSYSHYIRIVFDTEKEYNDFINWQQRERDTDNEADK